ncbi:hypothetical protein Nepgr_001647 [Nepenthes gracilis]|uniref:X8 domain-containing protein n=1 Tax=Nepenthes gracilis TaxID=150966 RepID=A0AAD3RXR6_NEPGR|nr:hypothetical protein Nepgr_001647 [Nepenthes gracilis]
MMAKGTVRFNSLFFLLLSSLTICTSGFLVGLSYEKRNNAASSAIKAISFLELKRLSPFLIKVLVSDHITLLGLSNTGVSVDIYLNQEPFEYLKSSKLSGVSWLKTHLRSHSSDVKFNSIIKIGSRISDLQGKNDLHSLLSTLKSTYSLINSLQPENPIKVFAAFQLPFLENMNSRRKRDLGRIFHFLKRTRSFVIVEAHIDGELGKEDMILQSIKNKANSVNSLLSHTDVPIVLRIKSPTVSFKQSADSNLIIKISRYSENGILIMGRISGLLVEVPQIQELENEEPDREGQHGFSSSHRALLSDIDSKTTTHDTFDPPTTSYPSNPATYPSTTPVNYPYNLTPTIITVPATNPSSFTPANPAATPVTVPSTTPVTVTPTNPFNSPASNTNPPALGTNPGAQPITNPVTTYPPTVGNVPVTTTPVTSMPPPAATITPIIPGQTWCIARSGVSESALQLALDYACGIGGADCSMIQQGASCYNPNTVENHASYAFNSYFQRNPLPSSCDFGGTAVQINTNPSSGSCIYPSLMTTSPLTTSPPVTTITPATTSSTSGASGLGYGVCQLGHLELSCRVFLFHLTTPTPAFVIVCQL